MSEVVVVDTNIIIAALISGKEELLFTLGRPDISFISSNFTFVELFKHSPRIQEKSKLDADDLFYLLRMIINKIELVDESVVSLGCWIEASRLCRDVDKADTAFVALSLQFNGKLWTKDKLINSHLIRNGFTQFFDPSDFSLKE